MGRNNKLSLKKKMDGMQIKGLKNILKKSEATRELDMSQVNRSEGREQDPALEQE